MAETWPRRGFREVDPVKDANAAGGGLVAVKEGTISRHLASNAFPWMNVTG